MNLPHDFETLKHKRLTTSELKYIIRTVIASQALYYLNVTPLTDVELSTLDNKLAQLWKQKTRLAADPRWLRFLVSRHAQPVLVAGFAKLLSRYVGR